MKKISDKYCQTESMTNKTSIRVFFSRRISTLALKNIPEYENIWVQIQKEVISDLKREDQFLSKEIWASRELCKPRFKLGFTADDLMEFLS